MIQLSSETQVPGLAVNDPTLFGDPSSRRPKPQRATTAAGGGGGEAGDGRGGWRQPCVWETAAPADGGSGRRPRRMGRLPGGMKAAGAGRPRRMEAAVAASGSLGGWRRPRWAGRGGWRRLWRPAAPLVGGGGDGGRGRRRATAAADGGSGRWVEAAGDSRGTRGELGRRKAQIPGRRRPMAGGRRTPTVDGDGDRRQ